LCQFFGQELKLVATENECRELRELTKLRGNMCEPVSTQIEEGESVEEWL